ncbi:hypothetical protein [Desulfosporosinus sp.]|uniref:hypothetical protein n=1 Tax=Desulfosporosinus sp. TaxID=157907 RepID=UPI002608D7D7|nr:hypothetical protein [Desulfosporosinus sp.]
MDLVLGSEWLVYVEAAIITGIFGIIAVLLKIVYDNKKGYEGVSSKIGSTDLKGNLVSQHGAIEESVNNAREVLNKEINTSSSLLLSKVEKIKDHLIKEKADQENSFKSMDKDQQKIMGHVEGIHALAKDWERTVNRNRELEAEVISLKSQIRELRRDYDRLTTRYDSRAKERENEEIEY